MNLEKGGHYVLPFLFPINYHLWQWRFSMSFISFTTTIGLGTLFGQPVTPICLYAVR